MFTIKPKSTVHHYLITAAFLSLATGCAAPSSDADDARVLAEQSDALMVLPAAAFASPANVAFGASVRVTADGGRTSYAVARFVAEAGDMPSFLIESRSALPVGFLVRNDGGTYKVIEGSSQPTTTASVSFGRLTLRDAGEYFLVVQANSYATTSFMVTLSNRRPPQPPNPQQPAVACSAPAILGVDLPSFMPQGGAEMQIPLNALLQTQSRKCHTVTGCADWSDYRVAFYDTSQGQLVVSKDGKLLVRTGTSVVSGITEEVGLSRSSAQVSLAFGHRSGPSAGARVSNAGIAIPRNIRFYENCADVSGASAAEPIDSAGFWTEYRAKPARITMTRQPRVAVDDTPPSQLLCTGAPVADRALISKIRAGSNSLPISGTKSTYSRNCTTLTGCAPWSVSTKPDSATISVSATGELKMTLVPSTYGVFGGDLIVDNGELIGTPGFGFLLSFNAGPNVYNWKGVQVDQSLVSDRCAGFTTTATLPDAGNAVWSEQAASFNGTL